MKKFLLGAAAGYVLGSRAGHARYEQIVRASRKVADHPLVQGAAGIAVEQIGIPGPELRQQRLIQTQITSDIGDLFGGCRHTGDGHGGIARAHDTTVAASFSSA